MALVSEIGLTQLTKKLGLGGTGFRGGALICRLAGLLVPESGDFLLNGPVGVVMSACCQSGAFITMDQATSVEKDRPITGRVGYASRLAH